MGSGARALSGGSSPVLLCTDPREGNGWRRVLPHAASGRNVRLLGWQTAQSSTMLGAGALGRCTVGFLWVLAAARYCVSACSEEQELRARVRELACLFFTFSPNTPWLCEEPRRSDFLPQPPQNYKCIYKQGRGDQLVQIL